MCSRQGQLSDIHCAYNSLSIHIFVIVFDHYAIDHSSIYFSKSVNEVHLFTFMGQPHQRAILTDCYRANKLPANIFKVHIISIDNLANKEYCKLFIDNID